MEIVDANVVLRYLLKDHKSHFPKSRQIIEKKELHIPAEVVAEIVYVLESVYQVPRPNITTTDTHALLEAFNIYKMNNIDFVDALLVSYNRVHNHVIHSFDKKVKKLCNFE